tara:strand:- start:394 stop:1035 length:642 start_codon:yes stop_codon:yes gene_type:complete
MKIVSFVPIKLNSERLPNKMLLPLGNKLLCQHIFEILLEVQKIIDMDIYCFCSDEKIKKYLPENIIFFKRDISLDSNQTKGLDIYKSFSEKINADIYGLFHATSPFIKSKSIINGFNKIIEENYDSSFSVSRIQTFTWYDNKPLNYNLNDIVRTQDIKPILYETSAFYIFKSYILQKYNRRIGENSYMVETDNIESIDIDEKKDYELSIKIIN